jgi:hypothetical protein
MMRNIFLLALAAVIIISTASVQSSFAQPAGDLFCGRAASSFSHVIEGTQADDKLYGTPQDDLIRGFAGDDVIVGNGGNDCLKGEDGNDSIWGGEGNDYIMGLNGNDKLVGDDGDDTIFAGGGDDDVWGGAGSDRLVGEAGGDSIHGDDGSDSVYGNEGRDYLWGGAQDDVMAGGADDDKLVGDDGGDQMWGGDGDDDLIGLAGNDRMVGDKGSDRLYGNAGDDMLYDDAGDDSLNGGDDGGIDGCYDVVGANSIFACEPVDAQDSAMPDLDIRSFGMGAAAGELYMQVYGQAGATVPDKPGKDQFGQVFVYVFFTDSGIWVINAHWECHAGSGCDPSEQHVSEWHAEKVVVGNVAGYANPCVTAISDERPATMDGQFARVSVPEASKIISGQTAAYNIQTNPDDPQQECIAELGEVFDSA